MLQSYSFRKINEFIIHKLYDKTTEEFQHMTEKGH